MSVLFLLVGVLGEILPVICCWFCRDVFQIRLMRKQDNLAVPSTATSEKAKLIIILYYEANHWWLVVSPSLLLT